MRNGCYSSHRRQRVREATNFDEDATVTRTATPSPERLAIDADDRAACERAIAALTPEFREVIVLRELEGLSYKEIAEIVAAPMGTVMSRLSRARADCRRRSWPTMGNDHDL